MLFYYHILFPPLIFIISSYHGHKILNWFILPETASIISSLKIHLGLFCLIHIYQVVKFLPIFGLLLLGVLVTAFGDMEALFSLLSFQIFVVLEIPIHEIIFYLDRTDQVSHRIIWFRLLVKYLFQR